MRSKPAAFLTLAVSVRLLEGELRRHGFHRARGNGSRSLAGGNYIQHYGLMREQHGDKHEKTGAEHSWVTYHYLSSYATFRVEHHSCPVSRQTV